MVEITPEKRFVLRRVAAVGNDEAEKVLKNLMEGGQTWQDCEIRLRRKIFKESGVLLPPKIKPGFWVNPIGKRVLERVGREE